MSAVSRKITVEEYFALEAATEIRYEYDDGMLIPMHGIHYRTLF